MCFTLNLYLYLVPKGIPITEEPMKIILSLPFLASFSVTATVTNTTTTAIEIIL